ncbi:MAG: DUF4198 domain-containing protein [Gemmatimonadales bacterium]
MPSRRIVTTLVAVTLAAVTLAAAHDMFLKPAQFFLKSGDRVLVRLLNGTFTKSENSIDRKRLIEVVVVSPGGRERIDTTRWNAVGDTSSFLTTLTGDGTHVLAASTKTNLIELDAKDFNEYLELDGLPDPLEARRKNGELGKDARERYAKHVKAMVQVGATRTSHFSTVLGHPAEIVPVTNPYDLKVGQSLRVRLLVDGKPVANQYTLYGGVTPSGSPIPERSTRSAANGEATIPITGAGVWYIKLINMTKLAGDKDADYESKWSTLTFAVR